MADFALDAEVNAIRAQVREFLAEHLTEEVVRHERETGDGHNWTFHRALAERRWLLPDWPVAEGGAGLSAVGVTVLLQDLHRADAPMIGMNTTRMPAAVLRAFGTAEQKAHFLPRITSGDVIICLGFTEPDSGSDVAAARTVAVPDGAGGWVINGQKMFTTLAHFAQYTLLLVRTNAGARKHRGLSVLLVPLDAPGIEIQPIRTAAGERSNTVFYTDVHVPGEALVGEVDGGWAVMGASLELEHQASALFWGHLRRQVDHVLAALADPEAKDLAAQQVTRRRLGRALARIEAARLLGLQTAWASEHGEESAVRGAMTKLYSAESLIANTRELAAVLGPLALAGDGSPGAMAGDFWSFAAGTSIYGGTSEIMRGVVAEHGLGLPRSR